MAITLVSTFDQFVAEMSGLESDKSFAKAKKTAYSAGVIEAVAKNYFTELLNGVSRPVRRH